MTATALVKSNSIDLETPPVKEEHKVFFGNLAFKTTKEALISFASTSGKVLDATIITKHNRSLGYGFVIFETENGAENAAKDLNSKSLDGRDINVEVARPKAEPAADAPQKTRKSKSNARRRSKSAAASSTKEDVPEKTNEKAQEKVEKKKSVKKEVAANADATTDIVIITSTDSALPSERQQEKTPEEIAKEAAARRKRNQKQKKRQNKKKSAEKATRATEPSKTTLFVANLPYATTDDDLTQIFNDYKLVSAHVARMNNGCSKGYGFVELSSEQEQLKALESVKDVVLEGRSIYLKIALSEQKVPSIEDGDQIEGPAKKRELPSKDSVVDTLEVKDTK